MVCIGLNKFYVTIPCSNLNQFISVSLKFQRSQLVFPTAFVEIVFLKLSKSFECKQSYKEGKKLSVTNARLWRHNNVYFSLSFIKFWLVSAAFQWLCRNQSIITYLHRKNDVETHLKFPVQIRPWLSNHECVSNLNKQCMMDYFNLHEIKNE